MKLRTVLASTAVMAAATVAMTGLTATPVDAKKLKIIAFGAPPPIVPPVKVTKEYFIPEVNKRLKAGGHDLEIEWTEAWASTLAKPHEVFEATEEGVGHLGVNIWVFEGSKLPLENVTFFVPFGTTDATGLSKVMRKLHERVPEMDKTYEKYNQVHLVSWGADSYQLVTKFPVKRFEDMKGHKVGASGTMGAFFRNTGAVVVSSAMTQAYTSMKNGVYDGYTAAISLAFPYKMHQAAKNVTRVNFGSTSGSGLTINRDMWDKLPGYAKKIFKEVAHDTALHYSKTGTARVKKFEAIMKKQGATISDFPREERKRWAMALPNIAQEWADRTDKKGLPGNTLFKAYMEELRALPNAKTDMVRQWDKE